MLKNRFILVIGVLSLLLVAMAASLPRLDPVIIPVSGPREAQPYIAWAQAMQVRNSIDSGTRSYIAWGEALEAAGKLGDSGVCPTISQENIFAGIDSNLDSATRSYIASGLALQAKDDIRALCR